MHTGDKLTGSVCKCMDCAGKRYDRIQTEARVRHRERYNAAQQQQDEANAMANEAHVAQGEARANMHRLHDETKAELERELA